MTRRSITLLVSSVGMLACVGLALAGCSKSTTKVTLPSKTANAKSALFEEARGLSITEHYVMPRPLVYFQLLADEKFSYPEFNSFNDFSGYKAADAAALNLGIDAADGLFLLYSGNTEKQKLIGASIASLTATLNLDKDLAEQIALLKAALQTQNYAVIRTNLDTVFAQTELKLGGRKQNSLATLISLGGWVEALSIATSGLALHYNDIIARKIIGQSTIVTTYQKILATMPAGEKTPLVKEIEKTLTESLAPAIIAMGTDKAPEASVRQSLTKINTSVAALKVAIQKH